MTKTVKITSRGRYVCPDGKVLFGPMGNFYKEDTATLKALLLGYPNIEIVERTASKKLVNINITNFNTNNDSAPVSMMEDNGPEKVDSQFEQDEQVEAPVEEPQQEKVEETAPAEEAPTEVQEQIEQPVEEAPVEVQTHNEQVEAPVEEPQQEKVEETAPVEEAPAVKEETKQPVYTKKDKKRHNKSTEVTPKEA